MKKFLLILPLLALAISGCTNSSNGDNNPSKDVSTHIHEHTFVKLKIQSDANKRTYLAGEDFDDSGLAVFALCNTCKSIEQVNYSLQDDTDLSLDQTSVKIVYEDLSLDYKIKVVEKYHIACVGDSLTAGHEWSYESYPTKLSGIVDEHYEVGNFGVNGISITGYGGNSIKYLTDGVYQKSLAFNPDIFAIMLGTNDATGWANAEATFDEDYHILLDSYVEQFPCAKFIMMVSPPTRDGNRFGIPNQTILDEINPRQRDLAEEYGFELLDLREEFEATSGYETLYLRETDSSRQMDGVHFTAAGAEYVANRVWDIAKDL